MRVCMHLSIYLSIYMYVCVNHIVFNSCTYIMYTSVYKYMDYIYMHAYGT